MAKITNNETMSKISSLIKEHGSAEQAVYAELRKRYPQDQIDGVVNQLKDAFNNYTNN